MSLEFIPYADMKRELWIEDAILWQRAQAFDFDVQFREREQGRLKNAALYQSYVRDDYILFRDSMTKVEELS